MQILDFQILQVIWVFYVALNQLPATMSMSRCASMNSMIKIALIEQEDRLYNIFRSTYLFAELFNCCQGDRTKCNDFHTYFNLQKKREMVFRHMTDQHYRWGGWLSATNSPGKGERLDMVEELRASNFPKNTLIQYRR